MDRYEVAVYPVHLQSLTAICDMFKKSRRTVKGWYESGAPIVLCGTAYSAEYNALMAWLVEKYKFKK